MASLTEVVADIWNALDKLYGRIPPGDYFRLMGCCTRLSSNSDGTGTIYARRLLEELKLNAMHPNYFTYWVQNPNDLEAIEKTKRNFLDVLERLKNLVYDNYR